MYYFPDKSFFCLLNYHNDSSTIPIAFIVKFWSTSIEVISSDTMKEDSLNYGKRQRQSQLRQRFESTYVGSVFINLATWN